MNEGKKPTKITFAIVGILIAYALLEPILFCLLIIASISLLVIAYKKEYI